MTVSALQNQKTRETGWPESRAVGTRLLLCLLCLHRLQGQGVSVSVSSGPDVGSTEKRPAWNHYDSCPRGPHGRAKAGGTENIIYNGRFRVARARKESLCKTHTQVFVTASVCLPGPENTVMWFQYQSRKSICYIFTHFWSTVTPQGSITTVCSGEVGSLLLKLYQQPDDATAEEAGMVGRREGR